MTGLSQFTELSEASKEACGRDLACFKDVLALPADQAVAILGRLKNKLDWWNFLPA